MKIKFFKGIIYRNIYFFNFFDFLKRGKKKDLRFKILKNLIKKKNSLIDVCGGCGWLKDYLHPSINYTVADASDEFSEECKERNINFIKINSKKLNVIKYKYDYTVMIISLYQFKKNIKKIIKNLKKISRKKVIIIEEIMPVNKFSNLDNIKKRIIDYLCNTDFSKNYTLFNFSEFESIMKKNKFKINRKFIKDNMVIGIFNIK